MFSQYFCNLLWWNVMIETIFFLWENDQISFIQEFEIEVTTEFITNSTILGISSIHVMKLSMN